MDAVTKVVGTFVFFDRLQKKEMEWSLPLEDEQEREGKAPLETFGDVRPQVGHVWLRPRGGGSVAHRGRAIAMADGVASVGLEGVM